jgi:hypothetical protein
MKTLLYDSFGAGADSHMYQAVSGAEGLGCALDGENWNLTILGNRLGNPGNRREQPLRAFLGRRNYSR